MKQDKKKKSDLDKHIKETLKIIKLKILTFHAVIYFYYL